MAKTLILKLVLTLSLLGLLLTATTSFEDEENDDDEYVVDSLLPGRGGRSRFLSSVVIKKGTQCDAKTNPYVCNGVRANKGTGLLYCCKKHCRNVLGDRNNCGRCGRKCQFGERCCGGVCTDVLRNGANCGKCGKRCGYGVACDNGYCGYA